MAAIYAREQKQIRTIREDSMKEHLTLTNEQSNRAIDTVRKNAQQERADLMFEEFKSSPYYSQMFDNLENMGTEALVNLRQQLIGIGEDAKKTFSPEQMKAWQDAINKVSAALLKENPNAAIQQALEDVKDSGILGEYGKQIEISGNVFKNITTAAKVNEKLQEKLNSLYKEGNKLQKKGRDIEADIKSLSERRASLQTQLNAAYEKAADKLMKNNGNDTWTDKDGKTYDKTQLHEVTVIANSTEVQNIKTKLLDA